MTAIQSLYDCGAVIAERFDSIEDWERRLGTVTGSPGYCKSPLGGRGMTGGAGAVLDFSKKNKTNYTAKSVVVWLTPGSLHTGTERTIFDGGYWSANHGDLIRMSASSDLIYIYLKNTSAETQSGSVSYAAGKLIMLGYSWDGLTVKYYKDGTSAASDDSFTGTVNCANGHTIGRSTEPLISSDKLHAIAIFDRALTATEMLDLAKGQPFDRISRSLVSEWRPGAGTTIPDLGWKNLGNNGAATNATALKTPYGWGAAFANGGIAWSTISFTGYEYIYATVGGQYHHYYYDGTNTYTDGIATGSMPLAITSTGFSGATCNMAYLAVRDATLTPLQVRKRYNDVMARRF